MATETDPNKTNETQTAKPEIDDEKINQIVTARMERRLKGFEDALFSKLDERFSALAPKPAAGKTTGAQTETDVDPNERIAALESELKAQKQRAIEKEVFADVKARLTGKVKPEAIDAALRLMKADGVVKIDARGNASIKIGGEVLDLEEGIGEWLKGDGAHFAPTVTPAPSPRRPLRAPMKPPARSNTAGARDENMTPAQKTEARLRELGLSLRN